MGKKNKASASATAPVNDAAIDDIFASKPKASTASTLAPSVKAKGKQKEVPPSSATSGELKDGEKDKKKKAKQGAHVDDAGSADRQTKKGKSVETILDPSAARPKSTAPVIPVEATDGAAHIKKKRIRKEAEDDEDFADSRGVGPSACDLRVLDKADKRQDGRQRRAS